MPLNHDNYNESPINVVEIFGVNKTAIKEKAPDFTREEIEILKVLKDKINLKESKVEFICEDEQMYWEYSLLRYINYEDYLDKIRSNTWRTR